MTTTTIGTFRIAGGGISSARHTADTAAQRRALLYDDCVPTYFPPETVVPLTTVRQLMMDFALCGRWNHAASWREHDAMVA
jgi:hypothetical protein